MAKYTIFEWIVLKELNLHRHATLNMSFKALWGLNTSFGMT